jgi:serine protease AprX
MKKLITSSRSVNWGGRLSILLVVALLLPFMATELKPELAPRAQPILLQMAAERPDATLSVIVQKAVKDTQVESLVARLGGTVTADLHIINAFGAKLPAKAITELSRADGVRWVSLDAPVAETVYAQSVDTTNLKNAYVHAIRASKLWKESPYLELQGQGIGVAVVDSGVNPQQDLYTVMGVNRLVASVAFNNGYNQSVYDGYGHGNHVAGIIGGNGSRSNGAYIGVAPMVNLINVKVSDDQGTATAANVVQGLQWINDNAANYNIRVVNLSLNSAVYAEPDTDPIDAAVEILWFNKVVVVVSAGNDGKNALNPPANDPFVITVGATDDKGTNSIADDVVASYSGYSKTADGIRKPDLVAPGTNIVALMANPNSVLATAHPANVVNGIYFRMSGTSMAAPMVSGAAALLLQDEPGLTPDQVKYRLMATANKNTNKTWPGYNAQKAGAGYLDVYAAVKGTSNTSANTGLQASKMLWTGGQPVNWNSVNWNSVNWNSVNWNSVNWNSVNWNSVNWNSDIWGTVK